MLWYAVYILLRSLSLYHHYVYTWLYLPRDYALLLSRLTFNCDASEADKCNHVVLTQRLSSLWDSAAAAGPGGRVQAAIRAS